MRYPQILLRLILVFSDITSLQQINVENNTIDFGVRIKLSTSDSSHNHLDHYSHPRYLYRIADETEEESNILGFITGGTANSFHT